MLINYRAFLMNDAYRRLSQGLGQQKQENVAKAADDIRNRLQGDTTEFLDTFGDSSRTVDELAGDFVNTLTKAALNTGQLAYTGLDLASRYNAPALAANKLAEQGIGQPIEGIDSIIAKLSDDKTGLYSNFDEAKQIADEMLASDVSKAERAAIQRNQQEFAAQVDTDTQEAIKQGDNALLAEGEGIARKFANTVGLYLDNPSQLLETSVEQIPSMLLGGIAGKAAPKIATFGKSAQEAAKYLATDVGKKNVARIAELAGVGTTAITEGLSNAAQTRGEIEKLTEKELQGSPEYLELRKTNNHEDARRLLAEKAFNQVFGQTALIAGAVSKVTGAGKFEGNLFNSATGNAAVRSAANAAKEGLEETVQSGSGQLIQNVAKSDATGNVTNPFDGVGEAAGAGAVTGAALGGALTFAASSPEVLSEAGRATAEAASKVKEKISTTVEPEEVKEARKTGDASKVTNTESADYEPEAALSTMLSPEFVPAKGESEADAEYQSRVEAYNAEIDKHLDGLEAKIGKAIADEDINEAKRMNTMYKDIVNAQDALSESLKTGDVDTAIKVAQEARGVEAKEAIQTVLGSKDFYEADLEQLESLAKSPDLTPVQRSSINAAIENKKSLNQVSKDIREGSKGFLGINEYASLANRALIREDFESARNTIQGLKKFADSQYTKATQFNEALKRAKAENSTEGFQVKVGNSTFRIHKGSSKLVETAIADSNAINNVLKNTVQQYRETAQVSSQPLTGRAPANTQAQPEITPQASTAPTVTKTQTVEPATQTDNVQAASQATTAKAATPVQPKKETKKTPKATIKPIKGLNTVGETALYLKSKGKLKPEQTTDNVNAGNKLDVLSGGIYEAELGVQFNQTSKNNLISKEGDLNELIATQSDLDFEIADTVLNEVPSIKRSLQQSINSIVDTASGKYLNQNPAQLLSTATTGKLGDDLNPRVMDAITYSTLEYFNTTGSTFTKPDSSQLKRLLGLDSKDSLTKESINMFKDSPVLSYEMMTSIGKSVAKSLGLKAKKNANKAAQAALETGLGQLAYLALLEQGVIAENDYKGKEIIDALDSDSFSTKFKEGNTYTFVSVADTTLFNELLATSKRLSKGYNAILGDDVSRAFPTFKPQAAPDTVTVNDQLVSDKQKSAINKYNKQKYRFNDNLMNSLDVLGTDFLRNIEGFNTNLDALHVLEREAQEVINNDIDKQIDNLNTLRTINNDNRAMYFNSVVDIQNRIRIDNVLVNPQSYKIQRHLLQMEGWKSTVNTKAERDVFKLALGQALGLDIDKQSNAATFAAIDYILDGNNELSNLIFDAAKLLDNVTEANKDQALDTLNKVFTKHTFEAQGKQHTIEFHGTHSLAALHALANYSPTTPFESSIFLEVDGITNGTAIGLLQLAPFSNVDEAYTYLEKTGMYAKGYRSYGQFKEAGNNDNYETLAQEMQQIVGTMTEWSSDLSENATQLQAVGNILGSISELNDLTLGLLRKVAKNPVMTGNYGAGVTKIIAGLENEVIAKLYTHIMKGVNAKDQAYLDMVHSQLAIALGYSPKEITVANGKDWVLSENDTLLLREAVQNTLGNIMEQALNATFKPLMDSRSDLNEIMEAGNKAFIAVYRYERAKITKETGSFTVEQEQELLKRINRLVPKVAHAKSDTMRKSLAELRDSITSKNLEAKLQELTDIVENVYSLKAYKKAKSLLNAYTKELESITVKVTDLKDLANKFIDVAGDSYDIRTALQLANKEAVADPKNAGSRVTTKLKGRAKKSKNTVAPVLEFADTLGVRPAVMLIQSIDSANMVDYMDSSANGMNIYDAIITGVNDAAVGTQALNKGMYDNNFNYSIYESANDYTTRALDFFYSEYGNVPELSGAKLALTELPFADAETRISKLKEVQSNRKMVKDTLEYVDQYYLQGAGYRTDVAKKVKEAVSLETEIKNYVDESVNEILGSQADSTGFEGQFSEFDVKASTVSGLMGMLKNSGYVKSSDSHFSYLTSLLERTYNDAIYPLKLKVYNNASETAGLFDDANNLVAVNVNTGQPLTSIDMSADEVFAHEMVHAITKNALLSSSPTSAALNKLFKKAKRTIKPSDLQVGSMDAKAAKERWNYIFSNPKKVAGTNYSVGLLEFVAFGLTNEKFKQALDDKAPYVGYEKAPTLIEQLVMTFERILNGLYAVIGKKRFNFRNKGLNTLVQELVKAELKAKNNAYNHTWADKADQLLVESAKKYVLSPLIKFTESKYVANNRFNVVQGAGAIVNVTAKGGLTEFKKVLDKVMYRLGLTENNLLVSLLDNITGRTDSNNWAMELNRKSKRMIDQIRADIAVNTQKALINKFSRELTTDEENAITKMLLKTDMQSLYGFYSNEEVVNLLKSSGRIDKELKRLEKSIKAEFPNEQKFYIMQSKSLANSLVTGRYTQAVALQNSHLIANLALTSKQPTGDTVRAEKLIDVYTSLQAFKQIRANDAVMTKALDKVIEDEFKVSTDENGITFSLLTHKHFLDKSLRDSFKGNKTQTVKGYVKEIYNPDVAFKVASLAEKDALELQGYEFKGAISKDSDDLASKNLKVGIFVNPNAGLDTWQSGGINLTDLQARGTEYYEVLAQTGLFDAPTATAAIAATSITKAKTAKGDAIYNGRDTSKPNANSLVPIFDDTMKVSGYRYIMTEQNKDELLERDNRFSHVLGATEGNFISKQNSVEVNKEYIQALHSDFVENYSKDKDMYVYIGESSSNQEYRELYRMLPDDARREVNKLFKGKGMFVKRDVVKLAFGQRKFSLTSYARAKVKLLEQTDKVANAYMLPIFKLLGGNAASTLAKSWVNLIKLVKDVIVIRSAVTLIGNIASNNLLLWTMGVPYNTIGSSQLEAAEFAEEYEVANSRLTEITLEIDAKLNKDSAPTRRTQAEVRRLKAERTELEDSIARNPVTPLIESGIYQSIIEDVEDSENVFTSSNPLELFKDSIAAKVPTGAKSIAKTVAISPDTKAYKFLRRTTQLSDFAARYTLHNYNLERGMSVKESLNKIEDVFINYDLPTHKSIQYMNDIGAVMFTKFFLRIQRIIYQAFKERPARMLSLMLAQDMLNVNVSDIADSNPITKDLAMMFNTTPVDAVEGLVTAHPIYSLAK